MHNNKLKIFIASSSEMKEEREKCDSLIIQLGKAHQHLHLDPVKLEYDLPHSNYPAHKNIQDAINETELKDCPVVLFIFFSKIGKHIREEYEYATTNKNSHPTR